MRKIAFVLMFELLSGQTTTAQLVINELMQSNVDCIMDDQNEYPDSWVELLNIGDASVSLKNYRLGVDGRSSTAWRLTGELSPKQHVIVYCDKSASNMHTDFCLESGGGGSIYLFKGSDVVDQVSDLPKQPAPNIAYGRKEDGSDEWGYQLKPTPGKKNYGQVTDAILGDPIFSELGRVISDGMPLYLKLSLPGGTPAGTKICYTTDCSEPTANSAKYLEPIPITSTTIVRAKLFNDKCLSPRSVTQSYIYFNRKMTLPIVSIATDEVNLTSDKIGIDVDGSYQPGTKNYKFNWRRPMNFELFDEPDSKSSINQLTESRIMGASSRKYVPRSMVFYANKRFGTKHFNYEFFPDQKPGLTVQKSILLRNAGGDAYYLYMRDAIIQRVMGSYTDLDWQPWRPAVIYINGIYRGILNIRERSSAHYVWANYGKLEDIDMVENWEQLKEGDLSNFNAFKLFYSEHGHSRQEYEKWMDCVEFINLMVMNLYFGNMDFPGNNSVMWRPRTKDGRWRFIAKDTDWGLGLNQEWYPSITKNRCPAYVNSIDWLINYNEGDYSAKKPEYTILFRYMMENPDLNREFIDRCCIYMGDFLNEKGVREIWDLMYEKIKTEYPFHRALIKETWLNYDAELVSARDWLRQRTSYFYKHLGSTYKLGDPIPMTINKTVENVAGVSVRFNGVNLSKGIFDGQFYRNRTITLEAEAPEGKEIMGWRIIKEKDGIFTEDFLEGSSCSYVMPKCSSLAIDAVLGEVTRINSTPSVKWSWHRKGDCLFLSAVPVGVRIQLYDVKGLLLRDVVSKGTDVILPLTSGQFHILRVGEKTLKF